MIIGPGRALLRAGLVDELNLLVHPIVLGKGHHLFDDLDQTIPLALESSASFGSGVVHAVYRKA
ncbi:dihydrofolate reductase family protein [Tenggerimyces flavus]|uniref:Dihydrofolate reductase family protein n=1 Tax=Tenggerimyces flavus TaxID=1708749 RepID=A0ABV7YF16_9ACTN|nr:dihydrofolate reductase family protein [Tenggerimyces flavus]MBM7787956.1 riboflavin biosynthesis pyrimidine reductase [Tenggerimyces flavus]